MAGQQSQGLLKLKGESKKIEFKSSPGTTTDKADPNSKRYQEDYDHTNKKGGGKQPDDFHERSEDRRRLPKCWIGGPS